MQQLADGDKFYLPPICTDLSERCRFIAVNIAYTGTHIVDHQWIYLGTNARDTCA